VLVTKQGYCYAYSSRSEVGDISVDHQHRHAQSVSKSAWVSVEVLNDIMGVAAGNKIHDLLHCRDAVLSGGFLYVLAVTSGNMPREGLSTSGGAFNNLRGGSGWPSDIYVAKVDLLECCGCMRLHFRLVAFCSRPCL
jgi:hypothetical protein